MRNLIIFIRRYFNFFIFLILGIFCLSLFLRRNNFQRTAYVNSANAVSGYLFHKYNTVQYYFHLKEVNDSLVRQNAQLLNQVNSDFFAPDTQTVSRIDSTTKKQYDYYPAQVVNNSVNEPANYLTLYRGREEGIEKGMGVIGPQGVVGIVRAVSPHYSVVMSLLNKDMRISAKLTSTGNFGSVRWDIAHANPLFGTLLDIPKNVPLHRGDSVITSGYSAIFPPGLLIGYVEGVRESPSSNFHIIKIRFATHFRNLQYVYIIKNNNAEEQKKVEATIPNE